MITTEPSMTNLFLQLGLDAEPEAIAAFVRQHQLDTDVHVAKAPYWNDAQRQFIAEALADDAPFALIVDQLNQALHEVAVADANEHAR